MSTCALTEHHCCGDERSSFKLAPEFVDDFRGAPSTWRVGGVPPLPELNSRRWESSAQAASDEPS